MKMLEKKQWFYFTVVFSFATFLIYLRSFVLDVGDRRLLMAIIVMVYWYSSILLYYAMRFWLIRFEESPIENYPLLVWIRNKRLKNRIER